MTKARPDEPDQALNTNEQKTFDESRARVGESFPLSLPLRSGHVVGEDIETQTSAGRPSRQDLNFISRDEMQPHTEYQRGDLRILTGARIDGVVPIVRARFFVGTEAVEQSEANISAFGKEVRKELAELDAGHLQARAEGGSSEDLNLIALHKEINRKGEWRSIEEQRRSWAQDGDTVHVDIDMRYSTSAYRPDTLTVTHTRYTKNEPKVEHSSSNVTVDRSVHVFRNTSTTECYTLTPLDRDRNPNELSRAQLNHAQAELDAARSRSDIKEAQKLEGVLRRDREVRAERLTKGKTPTWLKSEIGDRPKRNDPDRERWLTDASKRDQDRASGPSPSLWPRTVTTTPKSNPYSAGPPRSLNYADAITAAKRGLTSSELQNVFKTLDGAKGRNDPRDIRNCEKILDHDLRFRLERLKTQPPSEQVSKDLGERPNDRGPKLRSWVEKATLLDQHFAAWPGGKPLGDRQLERAHQMSEQWLRDVSAGRERGR